MGNKTALPYCIKYWNIRIISRTGTSINLYHLNIYRLRVSTQLLKPWYLIEHMTLKYNILNRKYLLI